MGWDFAVFPFWRWVYHRIHSGQSWTAKAKARVIAGKDGLGEAIADRECALDLRKPV